VRLRLRRTWARPGQPPAFAGDVVEVDEAVGAHLLADGLATSEPFPRFEVAMIGPAEVAAHTDRPAPRRRR
jgi:hypothetical protein